MINPIAIALAEAYGPDQIFDYTSDCWGSTPSQMTSSDVERMFLICEFETSYFNGEPCYKVVATTVAGCPVLYELDCWGSIGSAVLTLAA